MLLLLFFSEFLPQVLIKYVDYGNTARAERKFLRELDYEFTVLQCQVMECCLKGFDKIPATDTQRIQLEMMSEDAHGARKKMQLTVVDKLPNGVPIVNLYDVSSSPPIDISKRMVKLSVAPRQFSNMHQDGGGAQPMMSRRLDNRDGEIINSTTIDDGRSFRNNQSPGWTEPNSSAKPTSESSMDVPHGSDYRPKKANTELSRDSWDEPRAGNRQQTNHQSVDSWGEPRVSGNRDRQKMEESVDSWGEPRGNGNRDRQKTEESRDSWGEPRGGGNRERQKPEDSRDSWREPRSSGNRQLMNEPSRDSWGEPRSGGNRERQKTEESRDSWGEPRSGGNRDRQKTEESRDSWGEPRASGNRQVMNEPSRDSWGEPRSGGNRDRQKTDESRDSWGEPRINRNGAQTDANTQRYEYNKYDNHNNEKRDKFNSGGGGGGGRAQQAPTLPQSQEAGNATNRNRQNDNERNSNNNQRLAVPNDQKRYELISHYIYFSQFSLFYTSFFL